MEITNAKKKEDIIHKKVLEEKFQKMLSIQNEKIKERMTEGEKYVVWIFGDEEYYHNEFERCYKEEFEKRARILFEEADYTIDGTCIRWW